MFDEGVARRHAALVGRRVAAFIDAIAAAVAGASGSLEAIAGSSKTSVDVGGNQRAGQGLTGGGFAGLEGAEFTVGLDGAVGLAFRRVPQAEAAGPTEGGDDDDAGAQLERESEAPPK